MEYIILDDLFGVKLWNENIFRRVYHHLSNNNYTPHKIPLLYEVRQILTDDQVAYLRGLKFEKDGALNTNKLALVLGGQYSPRDTIYFNNMDKVLQRNLEEIGNKLIPTFEALVGTKLRLGDTNFRAIIIRYEGPHAQFGFHYDTEHPDCFRSLILYQGAGKIPPFCYRDTHGVLQKVQLQPADGILFRGTTTYHGVEPSNDENTKRYLIGFQYIKDNSQTENPTLNSELRGASFWTILKFFIPYSMYYHTMTYLPTSGYPISVSLCGVVFLSRSNIYSVGLFYLFCWGMTFNARLALHITSYILFTEFLK